MRTDNAMTAGGLAWVLASALLTVAANLLLRAGVGRGGGFLFSTEQIVRVFTQPVFLAGVLFYGLAALVWFRVISTQPLSSSYPLLVSFTFVLVTAGASYFFDERISMGKIGGIILILLGVITVARSS